MRFYHWLTALLFPPKCVFCGKLLEPQELDLCKICRTEVSVYPNCKRNLQFLDSFTAVWYYEGYVRRSLLQFKFYGKRHYAKSYGRHLAMAIDEELRNGYDLLTWIPVSFLRRLRRGYDQVELLAKAVGQELGTSPVPTLKKIRHNHSQSGIASPAQRKANVLGVYQCLSPELVRGRRILLLDDIFTTGATASEAARVLKTMGAKEVHCAAIAVSRKES